MTTRLTRYSLAVAAAAVLAVSIPLARPTDAKALNVTNSWVATTYWFNRGETNWVRTYGSLGGILGSWADPAVGAAMGTVWWFADQAYNRGGCLKLIQARFNRSIIYPQWYWGGYCW